MDYYRLLNKKMPWNEYGEILLTGTTTSFSRLDGYLQFARTGPFQPNMIIPGEIIVTETMKDKLQSASIGEYGFKKVIKKHISLLEWASWDLNAESPQLLPTHGDPENYIFDQPHSEELSNQMEEVYELVVPVNGRFESDTVFVPYDSSLELFKTEKRIDNTSWYIATEKMKNWLEDNGADYIEFKKIENQKEGETE